MKLPEPAAGYGHGCNVELADGQELYTADQMHKYRADAIAEAEAAVIAAIKERGAVYFASPNGYVFDKLSEAELYCEDDESPDPLYSLAGL